MAISLLQHPRPRRGFTFMEVMAASMVLAVGLVAVAAFMAGSLKGTRQSKYMSLATTLATEKLEDLMRWNEGDHHVYVPSGVMYGSLSSNQGQNITTRGSTVYINYFDQIGLSATAGSFSETVSSVSGTTTTYTTTNHFPSGVVSVASSTTAPTTISFLRRWTLEGDTPVAGVRRITVLVISQDPAIKPPVSYQISVVRP